MFEIVHTSEGWIVRSTTSGRTVVGPTRSLLDAECERAELEYEAQRDNDEWMAPLVEMGGYRHDG